MKSLIPGRDRKVRVGWHNQGMLPRGSGTWAHLWRTRKLPLGKMPLGKWDNHVKQGTGLPLEIIIVLVSCKRHQGYTEIGETGYYDLPLDPTLTSMWQVVYLRSITYIHKLHIHSYEHAQRLTPIHRQTDTCTHSFQYKYTQFNVVMHSLTHLNMPHVYCVTHTFTYVHQPTHP